MPAVGDTLRLVLASVLEREAGAHRQVFDGLRRKHLGRPSQPAYACADRAARPPTFPAILSTSPVCRPARTSIPNGLTIVDDRARALDAPGGSVERREEPVTSRVDLRAANGRATHVPLSEHQAGQLLLRRFAQ